MDPSVSCCSSRNGIRQRITHLTKFKHKPLLDKSQAGSSSTYVTVIRGNFESMNDEKIK